MDIMQIGSISTYLKQTNLQAQWDLKQETGNYSAHSKSLDEWLSDQTEATESYSAYSAYSSESSEDTKLQAIQQKLYFGGSLSYEEKAYLKEKDPVAYNKLLSAEQEKKSYEQALRQCKTKDQVQRLKMSHMGAALTELKAAKGDLSRVALVSAKVNALNSATEKFVTKGAYNALPTDVEKAQAEQELREVAAQRSETAEDAAEEAQSVEAPAEKTVDASAEKAAESDRAETAQESPEVRKVRRTKAAVYARWSVAVQETAALQTSVSLDAKA